MNQIAERLKRVPPIKRYRIGEIAEYTGLSRQTVHNYTVMGLIRENTRTSGGHRLYDESVFETLMKIEQLRSSRTLREIRNFLDDQREGDLSAGAEPAEPSVS
ncbi:MAG: MerR family transcriptional regulator [Planctomycetes bacterium]|nr:MerR family transcriptional regulator [Planctomycetota bacterium]